MPGEAGTSRPKSAALQGCVVGVGILFILTMLYGKAMGLAPVDCLLASCTLTLLLSQPMGIAGMTAGAIIGALTGAMVPPQSPLATALGRQVDA